MEAHASESRRRLRQEARCRLDGHVAPQDEVKGKFRFSVQSWDAAGHKSPASWGVLTLR